MGKYLNKDNKLKLKLVTIKNIYSSTYGARLV